MSDAERIKWDARYREGSHTATEPSRALTAIESLLPAAGPALRLRALDVGGGAGRHALWLARKGFDVTLVDVSEVGLALVNDRARAEGLTVHTVPADLERDPLPEGPWDLILVSHFLHRPLFAAFPGALAHSGLLVVLHPTRTNLERHDKPGAAFLLEDGELPGLVRGLTIVRHDEGWLEEGRHEARLVARKD
jgi:tellurite methyltransferase